MVYKEHDEDKKAHGIYDSPGSLYGNRPETDSASPRSLGEQSVSESAPRVDQLR